MKTTETSYSDDRSETMKKLSNDVIAITLAITTVMLVGCDSESDVVTSIASSAISFVTDAITILLQSLVPSAS
jgi:hypothetical protein